MQQLNCWRVGVFSTSSVNIDKVFFVLEQNKILAFIIRVGVESVDKYVIWRRKIKFNVISAFLVFSFIQWSVGLDLW